MSNALTPPVDAAQPPAPGGGASAPLAPPESQHLAALAQFKSLKEIDTNLTNVRLQLDKLSDLGDLVTGDELMKSAATLVSKGLPANQMAALLADAPDGGPALAGWLRQQDEKVTLNEQQMQQQLGVARHQLGVAALHLLVHHAAGQGGQPEVPGTPPAGVGNALAPPGPGVAPVRPTLQ